MDTSVFNVLKMVLSKNHIWLDWEEMDFQLRSHPSYPSLHSLTGVLSHFKVENEALEVPVDMKIFSELPPVFMAVVQNEYACVEKNGSHGVLMFREGDKKQELDVQGFLKVWDGVMIAVGAYKRLPLNDSEGRKATVVGRITMLMAMVGMAYLFVGSGPNFSITLHFLTSLAGIAMGMLLVRREHGVGSGALDRFCNMGKNTDCTAVLQSKTDVLFGTLNFANASLLYFLSMAISWFVVTTYGTLGMPLVLLSLLPLPITAYSIYYQAKVAKKWCPLCLVVVALLWLQAGTAIWVVATHPEPIQWQVWEVVLFGTVFMTSLSIWIGAKPYMDAYGPLKDYKVDLFRLKRNYSVFKALHHEKELLSAFNSSMLPHEIRLGRSGAPIELVVITNPQCNYCREANTKVKSVLLQHNATIKVTIRFNVPVAYPDDLGYQVAHRLTELFNIQDSGFHKALDAAYSGQGTLAEWLREWGRSPDHIYDGVLREQQKWCLENDINFTPLILLDGREIPEGYDLGDISFFTEDILERKSIDVITESFDFQWTMD
ncbi:MAG: vitamin K epoxide reductase family protein [Flavobacteriaceae bacterium]